MNREIFSISVEQMRRADAYTIEHLVPSKELMYRAGYAAYKSVVFAGKILIVCGSGNNAGDGYVMAQLLQNDGMDVHILLLKEKFSEDGLYYFNQCKEAGITYSMYEESFDFSKYDFIIDCIYGTGFQGEVLEPTKSIIIAINESSAKKISIDINSGMNGDTGEADICIDSDITISIGYIKHGLLSENARKYIKELSNVDIGIVLEDVSDT